MCANNAIFDHPSRQCVPNGRGRCWARENGTEFRMVAGNFTQPPFEEEELGNAHFSDLEKTLINDSGEDQSVDVEE